MNNRIKDALQANPISSEVAAMSRQFEGRVYLVGGLVRDIVMGRESDSLDIDIAVEGAPHLLGEILRKTLGAHLFPISREFDTWRVVSPDRSERPFTIDITPIRGGSIDNDLLGRDFSINSIAMDLSSFGNGEYVTILDPCKGMDDISLGIIRSIDINSFKEDPLRLIRALRFENILGFKIEEETERFIREESASIKAVSGERIREEFLRVFHEGRVVYFFKRMRDSGLLCSLMPELREGVSGKNLFTIMERAELLLSTIPDYLLNYRDAIEKYFAANLSNGLSNADILRLSALFYQYPTLTETTLPQFAKYLKLGRKGERLIKLSLSNPMPIMEEEYIDKRSIYRLIRDSGEAAIIKIFLSIVIKGAADDISVSLLNEYKQIVDFYFTEYRGRGELLLTGTDIIEYLNVSPGPDIGRLLDIVQEEYILGNISSREEAFGYLKTIPLNVS